MFTRLMNLDCELMTLGTKLFVAKSIVGSNVRYRSHLAAVKADKITTNVKKSISNIGNTTKKEKSNTDNKKSDVHKHNIKIDVKHEHVTTSDEKNNVQLENIVIVPDEHGMNIEVITEDTSLKYGPDFSNLQQPIVVTDVEPEELKPANKNQEDLKVVTPEDIDKIIATAKVKKTK